MKKSITLAVIFYLLISSTLTFATEMPAILKEWAKYAGHSDSVFTAPILSDGDYTYVAASDSNDISGIDIIVIKYGDVGQEVWKIVWSGPGGNKDYPSNIAGDASYIYVCGATFTSTSHSWDFVTLKIDKSDGTIEWSSIYNGSASIYDVASAIGVSSRGVFVTGASNNTLTSVDYTTIEYDIADGTQLWANSYDYGNLMDIPFDLTVRGDTEVAVTGGSQSSIYDWDYATVIYDDTGAVVSTNRATGTASGFDRAQAVKADLDGNIYITGASQESGRGFDMKTVKIGIADTVEWLATFDLAGEDDEGNDLIIDNSGNVYVCGDARQGDKDFLLVKYDHAGHETWSLEIDRTGEDDIARRMCFDAYGNIILTGDARSGAHTDFLTIAISPSGDELWRDYFSGPNEGDDRPTDIAADGLGNIYVTGQVDLSGSPQTVTIKYRTDYYTEPTQIDTPSTACLFYPNNGQIIDDLDSVTTEVAYYTVHHYPQLYFGTGVMNMVWAKYTEVDTAIVDTMQRVDVSFLYSNNSTSPYPLEQNDSAAYLNYFLDHCPEGITEIRGNKKLLFGDIYSGIDAIYSSNSGGLKLYFICEPHTDPSNIGLLFAGQDNLQIVNNWGLQVETALGNYVFEKPRVYQLDSNDNIIPLSWQLSWYMPASDQAKFSNWGVYDEDLRLVIEVGRTSNPNNIDGIDNLEWSTYCGVDGDDHYGQMVSDDIGNLYTIGYTNRNNFPHTSGNVYQPYLIGSYDAIISKFLASPTTGANDNFKWTTYYGGRKWEYGAGIAVNYDNGEIYFVGTTNSDDLPHGSILPGNSLASNFISTTFNGSNGSPVFDGYIGRLNIAGTDLKWSEYIGGGDGDGCLAIAFNQNNGSIYVAGHTASDGTHSPSFPLVSPTGAYNQTTYGGNNNYTDDGFIMSFKSSNHDDLVWSTYFGGNSLEHIKALVVTTDKLIAVGITQSHQSSNLTCCPCSAANNHLFPLCNNGSSYSQTWNPGTGDNLELFLAGFSLTNNQLEWSTYYGGDVDENIGGYDFGSPISSPTNSGKWAITGWTNSRSFPIYPSPPTTQYINTHAGDRDAYIAEFEQYSQLWSTYFGGAGDDAGCGITYDQHDNLFVTGSTAPPSCSPVAISTTCGPPSNGEFPLCHNLNYYYNDLINLNINPCNSDAFIAEFDPDRSLVWSTYFGGSLEDVGGSLAISGSFNNDLFLYGRTNSPFTNPFPQIWPPDYYDQTTSFGGVQDVTYSKFNLGLTIGINKLPSDKYSLSVYPNPTTGEINIMFSSNSVIRSENLDFEILDISGRLVLKNKLIKSNMNAFTKKISINNLAGGMYYIKIISDTGIIVDKFTKN